MNQSIDSRICWLILAASLGIAYTATVLLPIDSYQFQAEEIFPVRKSPPLDSSTWKPVATDFWILDNTIPNQISQEGTIRCSTTTGSRLNWKNGSTETVTPAIAAIPKGPDSRTNKIQTKDLFYVYSPNNFSHFFRKTNSELLLCYGDLDSPELTGRKAIVSDPYREYGSYFLNAYGELTYLDGSTKRVRVLRNTDSTPSKEIISLPYSDYHIIDVLPTKFAPGSHIIIDDSSSIKVYSDGKPWNIKAPRGFTPLPRVFVDRDTVAGLVLKRSESREIESITVAFWNRNGEYCLIDDALPQMRTQFESLLSTKGGLNPSSIFFTNYAGLIAIKLYNYGSPESNRDSERMILKSLILRLKF